MSTLNIIQRRELEPLMLKAANIMKHYEKAVNCAASVIRPDGESTLKCVDSICRQCTERNCISMHTEAVNKARESGGSYIYLCPKNLVFWTSPFYSGERLAGSLLSGGVQKSEKNSDKVKSFAQIMLLCADQISRISFNKKNNESKLTDNISSSAEQKHEKSTDENSIYPIDMERMLLASLRRGDNSEGRKILEKLLNYQYQEIKNKYQENQRMAVFRLKALELAVLLSRAAADPKDIKDNTSLETTNKCMKKIEESKTFNEISEILFAITERMSGMIFSYHGVRHFSALRKAERFIWEHYTRKLSLKEIATASGLSAPYFSTVFKEEMGENLSNYLNRLRTEKAAVMLAITDKPINEVAAACGFEDQSWFSKIFKNNIGLTPGKYRECGIASGDFSASNTAT